MALIFVDASPSAYHSLYELFNIGLSFAPTNMVKAFLSWFAKVWCKYNGPIHRIFRNGKKSSRKPVEPRHSQ